MEKKAETSARRFGILERLRRLEAVLLKICGVEEVNFDVSNYDEIPYVIVLVKYNIPVEAEDYFARRTAQLRAICQSCRNHDLHQTGDRVEDYGEHWYIVRSAGKSWPHFDKKTFLK